MQRLLFGIDVFLGQIDQFKNFRFALVTNNAATTSDGSLSRVALMKQGANLIKLFSPEHGLTAQGEDGVFQNNATDKATGLPVISLYGDRIKPSSRDLDDIDAVLFDVPDAGCRFYTYLWTMTYVMEVCEEGNKSFIILDRPNPIGGDFTAVEGPMLDETHCSSFVGRWSIPVRHSCTLAELGSYFAATRVRNLRFRVFKMPTWKRTQMVPRLDSSFVPPSPAIGDQETAFLYPGTGLLEGINLNEGRGTDHPFKIFGAPWMNPVEFHQAFEAFQFAGVRSEPCSYKPSSGLYAAEECHGVKLTITDPGLSRPVSMGLQTIALINSLYPEHCDERLYKTTANPTGEKHLDKLIGVVDSFRKIKNGEIRAHEFNASAWRRSVQSYLLYD